MMNIQDHALEIAKIQARNLEEKLHDFLVSGAMLKEIGLVYENDMQFVNGIYIVSYPEIAYRIK